jgi:hypothetical protein
LIKEILVMDKKELATLLDIPYPVSKPGGLKYDDGKPPLDLLDTYALTQVARVLAFGAGRYGRHNWRAGIEWSRVIAAAMRHITKFNDGEDFDSDTGISHLAHAICCCMFLLNYTVNHKQLDDRYKKETK